MKPRPPSSNTVFCLALGLLLGACAAPPGPQPEPPGPSARDEQALERERALAEAEAAVATGDAIRGEFWLDAARPPEGAPVSPRYRRARAALQALREDPAGAALARIHEAIDRLRDYDAGRGVALMQLFEEVPSGRLLALSRGADRMAAWASLALSVRKDLLANEALLPAATRWEANHPGHPVRAAEYMELCWAYRQRFAAPERIAVLLPARGGLVAAGEAIRDGLLLSWLDRPAASQLDFIFHGDDPSEALSAYQRAAADGYQWVIGPLRREATQLIADLLEPPVPALLLNDPLRAPARRPGGPVVFNLSLSQQAEVTSLARRIRDSGYQRAILLVVDNAWGQGVVEHFLPPFEAAGGEIVDVARFDARQADHADTLAQVLRIEDSRQRKSALQTALGLPLEFEASRRDDFDVLFLIAEPVLGRQIRPQLRFFDAGDKPIYAMGRIYSGLPDPGADQDLNGVRFAATRNAIDAAPSRTPLASLRGGAFGALHAIGADAWGILPWLEFLQKDPDLAYPGASGQLRLAPDGSLHREPVWARFENGRPVADLPAGNP